MNDATQRLRQADRAMGLRTAPRGVPSPTGDVPEKPLPSAFPVPSPASSAARVVVSTAGVPTVGHQGPVTDRAAALEALRVRHDAECSHCTTATAHTHTVFGEGSPTARLMFVGEAPGESEDRSGRPFVGRAGQKLDEMIHAMGLAREQVYIANVLKSRPPDNRTPLQHEVDACGPWLIEQIRIIRPEVIVTLGGPATKLMLGTDEGITRLRGVWASWQPTGQGMDVIPVMPTYHPAYLLRNYTAQTRAEIWTDLQAVMERLGLPRRPGTKT